MHVARVEQMLVLDEQQCVNDERRDLFETVVDGGWIACFMEQGVGPVVQGQPRLVLCG